MAKCIRCGKPCANGENMCDECKAWFQEKTGGSVVPGVKKQIPPKKENKVEEKVNKPVSSEPQKEVQQEGSSGGTAEDVKDSRPISGAPTPSPRKGGNIVLSKKSLYMIIGGVIAVIVIVILIVALGGNKKNDVENYYGGTTDEAYQEDHDDWDNEDTYDEEYASDVDGAVPENVTTEGPEATTEIIVDPPDEDTEDLKAFSVDYSKVLNLSNYEYIETKCFSFYAPTFIYDYSEIDEIQNYYKYYSDYNNEDDYISFSATPYGKYYYDFETPDELLDILSEEYDEEYMNILLKTYKSDSSDGIGRLVYDISYDNSYHAISFYDDMVYEMVIAHRDPESAEEARWMDYYINVLYRGCSFTRYVGPMYTYEEYLEEQ